ncbi:LysR substrate-binding domain-containing protein [Paucibacter sp. APW11]|uniref:LysR substrate-binding domain-containing protein n=1 Tax=Roseateles aquae TaxID=3077235 RepID=A0ABU3PH50_9BURK|nr:LysR substrate-binding domain-containing protein [Paucibacter sp. APW11]MDT9001784.1 LysR substrate-binding domain-containing protein [Paucibacter sp. APW11]
MNLFVSLKYLVALDDHRHFGRAALACHVTQPALSNAIRALEENYGCAIVKRGRNFAGFTEEGERVLHSARLMLREQELLTQDLASRAEAPRGQLLIGAVPTAMPIAARFAALLQDRHPGIVPTLRSLSSVELESGLEALALDMALGYIERMADSRAQLRVLPQYTEHYFLLQRSAAAPGRPLQLGEPMRWAEAATLPLCLLSAEMHNRRIVDRAFASAGCTVNAAIESNSTVTLLSSVQVGRVSAVLPGALLGAIAGDATLEARPLIEPQVEVPIAFMVQGSGRHSRSLQAALALAESPEWLAHAARHAGAQAGLTASAAPPQGQP